MSTKISIEFIPDLTDTYSDENKSIGDYSRIVEHPIDCSPFKRAHHYPVKEKSRRNKDDIYGQKHPIESP